MFDTLGDEGTREYVWFALLLIMILATSAVQSVRPNVALARADSVAP